MSAKNKSLIRNIAIEEGFDAIAITSAKPNLKDFEGLSKFIKKKHHGDMAWIAESHQKRSNPQKIMKTAKSIITFGANYSPRIDPLGSLKHPSYGTISSYAKTSKDYHDVVKKALKRVGRRLVLKFDTDIKVFVDTAPIMEKPLAARAGLGWQGKHTNLVSKKFGSWLFLGEIFTTLMLEPDLPEPDHCGSCDACIKACPTNAFPNPYELDSKKCISYLTVEHKGDIDPKLMTLMGNRIYGCDDCLAVCPWNKFSTPTLSTDLEPRLELCMPELKDLAQLNEFDFRKVFSKSPIKRTGRDRFIRNVLIGIGNSKDYSLVPIIDVLTNDKSPLVAKTAKWAIIQLQKAKKLASRG
jgi:epoxyqueuosine reductase